MAKTPKQIRHQIDMARPCKAWECSAKKIEGGRGYCQTHYAMFQHSGKPMYSADQWDELERVQHIH